MKPYYQSDSGDVVLYHGDCRAVMAALADGSVDAVVTDPPAGISFMGRSWDADHGGRDQWVAWLAERLAECRRILKPGGHALVWSIPRTSHWTGAAIEDAGFEPRDCIVHLFGSGFPKSLNVSKAIDAAAGAEREVVGRRTDRAATPKMDIRGGRFIGGENGAIDCSAITAPSTDAAKQWNGWGTALKPAAEFWWLARKPLCGTVAANVQQYGTGALNIDGCRVPVDGDRPLRLSDRHDGSGVYRDGLQGSYAAGETSQGRWPANIIWSMPEDEYILKCDVTNEQKSELFRWLSENPE